MRSVGVRAARTAKGIPAQAGFVRHPSCCGASKESSSGDKESGCELHLEKLCEVGIVE